MSTFSNSVWRVDLVWALTHVARILWFMSIQGYGHEGSKSIKLLVGSDMGHNTNLHCWLLICVPAPILPHFPVFLTHSHRLRNTEFPQQQNHRALHKVWSSTEHPSHGPWGCWGLVKTESKPELQGAPANGSLAVLTSCSASFSSLSWTMQLEVFIVLILFLIGTQEHIKCISIRLLWKS